MTDYQIIRLHTRNENISLKNVTLALYYGLKPSLDNPRFEHRWVVNEIIPPFTKPVTGYVDYCIVKMLDYFLVVPTKGPTLFYETVYSDWYAVNLGHLPESEFEQAADLVRKTLGPDHWD